MGCQSTHARLREPETTAGQPAPVSTKAPGARDYCRATSPRVYKSSWNPRLLQGNRPPCLQKFLDLSTEGNRPSSLEQGLSARDCGRATSPRVYKSSSKAGPLGTTSPTAIQISPFIEVKKLNYPSRHALRNQGTTPGSYEGNRPSSPHRSSSSAGG